MTKIIIAPLERIIDLQRQVRIARTALERIKNGHHANSVYTVAGNALDEMWKLDQKQPQRRANR